MIGFCGQVCSIQRVRRTKPKRDRCKTVSSSMEKKPFKKCHSVSLSGGRKKIRNGNFIVRHFDESISSISSRSNRQTKTTRKRYRVVSIEGGTREQFHRGEIPRLADSSLSEFSGGAEQRRRRRSGARLLVSIGHGWPRQFLSRASNVYKGQRPASTAFTNDVKSPGKYLRYRRLPGVHGRHRVNKSTRGVRELRSGIK